jgi:hypothetical protein
MDIYSHKFSRFAAAQSTTTPDAFADQSLFDP